MNSHYSTVFCLSTNVRIYQRNVAVFDEALPCYIAFIPRNAGWSKVLKTKVRSSGKETGKQ